MTDFNPEVPARVQHLDHIQNQVQVQGGTNWDLARSAVATPIATLPDPEPIRPGGASEQVLPVSPYLPQHKMPLSAPHTTVTFSLNSLVVPADAQKALRTVPKGVALLVAGHADPHEKAPADIARKRAEAVASYLRKQGRRIEQVRTFGGDVPLTESAFKSDKNRRVEVFVP